MAANPYTVSWWEAAEIGMWSDAVNGEAVAAFRKNAIKRGSDIRAREFDNALSGARKVTVREIKASNRVIGTVAIPDTINDKIHRAERRMIAGDVPVFVRPRGYKWTTIELEIIREARIRWAAEPSFLEFSPDGIDRVPGPKTDGSEWAGAGYTETPSDATL